MQAIRPIYRLLTRRPIDDFNVRRHSFAWMLSIIAAVLAAQLIRRHMRSADRGGQFPDVSRDCEVSECGPDGVPLSIYAG